MPASVKQWKACKYSQHVLQYVRKKIFAVHNPVKHLRCVYDVSLENYGNTEQISEGMRDIFHHAFPIDNYADFL